MKTKFTVLTFLLFIYVEINAQAPFTTLVKEPVAIEKINNQYKTFDIVSYYNTNKSQPDFINVETSIKSEDNVKVTKNKVGFFKNSSLALNILQDSENRASINSQVLFYKISILTPVEEDPKNYKYNIPAMIISKLSTSYDSISGASAIDVLDYEAAPVTLRIMPSWKISKNDSFKEQLLFGFYADARGINVQSEQQDKYDLEVVGSAGVGFTMTGQGEAGFYNEEGNYEKGDWLVSAMFQGAIGESAVIQRLFNTDNDYVTSFQAYFMFKVSEESKFNLKVGYQHFFQETIGGTKNNFSIALGL